MTGGYAVTCTMGVDHMMHVAPLVAVSEDVSCHTWGSDEINFDMKQTGDTATNNETTNLPMFFLFFYFYFF